MANQQNHRVVHRSKAISQSRRIATPYEHPKASMTFGCTTSRAPCWFLLANDRMIIDFLLYLCYTLDKFFQSNYLGVLSIMKNRTRTQIFLSDNATREQIVTLGAVTAFGILMLFITIVDGGNFDSIWGFLSILFLIFAAMLMMPTGALFLFKLMLDLNDSLRGNIYKEHH